MGSNEAAALRMALAIERSAAQAEKDARLYGTFSWRNLTPIQQARYLVEELEKIEKEERDEKV